MTEQSSIEFCYGRLADEYKPLIRQFWEMNNALPANTDATERLTEVAALAWNESELVGVSTVVPLHFRQLGQNLYNFRCFVSDQARRQHVASRLINAVYDGLNQAHGQGQRPAIIGMAAVAQNKWLQQHNHAVWPYSKFVFIGYDASGCPVRVRYFDGARIGDNS